MAIQFPSNPAVNDTYTYNFRTWVWSGTRWIVKFGIGSNPKDITWLTTQTSNFTAQSGFGYPVNTTSAAITVTLPASPSAGDLITLTDYAGTFATNNMVVANNGNKINGSLVSATFATNQSSVQLVYVDSTQGWKAYSFSVTSLTQTIPVDYLVVAGGGSGGNGNGGGGGAGGFRTGITNLLINSSYIVTVGAGGTSTVVGVKGTNGSNSIFDLITSTGGGAGAAHGTSPINGSTGGSGGGGARLSGLGAAGNTPATTPSQGNAGGNGASTDTTGGGGGGAGAAGTAGSPSLGGAGGIGAISTITGTSTYYAGGGGGGGYGITGGTGGLGGGSSGTSSSTAPPAATVNTGGGGGAAGWSGSNSLGGQGGSGVVIIAYPDTYPALTSIGAGLTYDQPTRSGYRVYRFTAGTGTISW